jgi:cytochrome c peroxidase
MRLVRHRLSALVLTSAGLGLLVGCLEEKPDNIAGGGPAVAQAPAPPPRPPARKGGGPDGPGPRAKGKRADRPAEKVTPVSGIDPKKQVDVVKEETQGGEAAAGGSPFDYLWQPAKATPPPDEALTVEVPLGLQPIVPGIHVPLANPMTKAKAELGKQLYFDPRVSLDGTVSCATCHNPEKGWTDQMAHSSGIDGLTGSRSAPTVLNTVYGRSMFWDGRAPSLEAQAQGPIQNPIEMGKQSYKEIVERLRKIDGYQQQFRRVFGTDVTLDGMAKAIATFERTVLSGNSAYDRYVKGDPKALTEAEKRGMVMFGLKLNDDDPFKAPGVNLKKANCTSCHSGPNFTDEQFHNLGVGYNTDKHELSDLGKWAVTSIGAKFDADRGRFKTPTTRDLLRTAPYMHDGSERTLEAVVDYYDRGGNANDALDPEMKKLNLTAQEKADVVAFLKALTSPETKFDFPTLPSGPDGKVPDPRAALTPPAKKGAMAERHLLLR